MSGISARVPLLHRDGAVMALVEIWATRKNEPEAPEGRSLHVYDMAEAALAGEEPVQLRERERYEFVVLDPEGKEADGWTLRPQRGISPSRRKACEGTIETGDFCGVLALELCAVDDLDAPLAVGLVEVRSLKLGYREDYQAMLSKVAEKSAQLLLDHNAATQNRLTASWRDDPPLVQQQLEFLRHVLQSREFHGAVAQILKQSHRRMEMTSEASLLTRVKKVNRAVVSQLTRWRGQRTQIPKGHAIREYGLRSVPRTVMVKVGVDDFDTAENRFVKMMLADFADFLDRLAVELDRRPEKNAALRKEVGRLGAGLDGILRQPFFQDLSRPESLPLGSPVLQRKSGYRELYHLWLQFHASAQLHWDGGAEIWRGGARNVATLYEYWLFFVLEELFRKKFLCYQKLHSLIVEEGDGVVRMNLRRGITLNPAVDGHWSKNSRRRLRAQFRFNHKFAMDQAGDDRADRKEGSWTRGVQPDYTISIWPAEFTADEAEENEQMVHVHFDAKYRVAGVLDGFDRSEGSDEMVHDRAQGETEGELATPSTSVKYADLLKMHAYRDAIRRTGGAYVLYPGETQKEPFRSFFHEVLPGLGAFVVRPGQDGTVIGLDAVSKFLDEVIDHLSNRTTAHERSRFHHGEAMSLREEPIRYNEVELPERDVRHPGEVAIPPEEHKILLVWSKNDEQLAVWKKHGIAYVRLGDRRGSLQVNFELAEVRHVLYRRGKEAAEHLWKVPATGFQVMTGSELGAKYGVSHEADNIYAVFKGKPDPSISSKNWTDETIWKMVLERFEKQNPGKKLSQRRSADPRVVTLRDLMKTKKYRFDPLR